MNTDQNKRLTYVREQLGFNITQMAGVLDIQQSTLSQMEKGSKKKGDTVLYVPVSKSVKKTLYRDCGVVERWFETGEGKTGDISYKKIAQSSEKDYKSMFYEMQNKYTKLLEETNKLLLAKNK